jgi:hypothetical protein
VKCSLDEYHPKSGTASPVGIDARHSEISGTRPRSLRDMERKSTDDCQQCSQCSRRLSCGRVRRHRENQGTDILRSLSRRVRSGRFHVERSRSRGIALRGDSPGDWKKSVGCPNRQRSRCRRFRPFHVKRVGSFGKPEKDPAFSIGQSKEHLVVRSLRAARRRQWRGGSRSVVPRGTSFGCRDSAGLPSRKSHWPEPTSLARRASGVRRMLGAIPEVSRHFKQ